MRRVELGVFIPIANNGWIISKTAPQYMPTFKLNRQICELAEQIGFDFAFSMSKWRGFGGETNFWEYSLESLTLMAGLAAVTRRLKIYASVQPLLVAPAIAAKMAATIDDISAGRSGINIVTGSYPDESAQMGMLPPDYDSYRYDYAEEWITVIKRLWTEPSVSFHGKYFQLRDCKSDPKPLSKPHPQIVCAGISENGMRFTARHGTHSFLGGRNFDEVITLAQKMKAMARDAERRVKAYTVFTLIQGESDAHADELFDYYSSGADTAALQNVTAIAQGSSGQLVQDIAKKFVFFGCQPLTGGPEKIASILDRLIRDGELDGVMFCFPDFIQGLEAFQRGVMPLLDRRGLR
ncbi:MAG: LLM class flavin-dependent oxidoreductase [Candidatus Binataceae bacterium]|nr:LLM class flavin-dependent oxidoreductase [Candidatus Binataceae bacterium]